MRDGLTTLAHVALVLQEHQLTGAISVRRVGQKGISEIQEKFAVYISKYTDSKLKLPYAKNINREKFKETAGQGSRVQAEDLHNVLNAVTEEIKKRRLHEEATIEGQQLKDWLKLTSSSQNRLQRDQFCRLLARSIHHRTIAEELQELLLGIPARNLVIFHERFGPGNRTLEEIGKEQKLTRERVRQVSNRTKDKILARLPLGYYCRLQSAMLFASEMGTEITFRAWTKAIISSGLVGEWNVDFFTLIPRVTPLGVMLAIIIATIERNDVLNLRLPENLRIVLGVNQREVSAGTIKQMAIVPKQITRAIRKEAKNGGAVHVPSTAKKLGLSTDGAQNILLGWGYLKLSNDWYTIKPRKSNKRYNKSFAAFHTVLRTLKYCGPLEIKEIRRGLQNHASRRQHVVPPPQILARSLQAIGFDIQDGIVSWRHENKSEISASEECVLRELERIGPVVSFFDLSQTFAEAGLSSPALSVVLRYSPLISRVDTGLYKLRGRQITLADIHKAQERQTSTAANPELLYEQNGTIRFRLNLGNLPIVSGVIFSTHIPNLSGEWSVEVNETPTGIVRVRENKIWGLAKAIREVGVKVGDRVELKFDTWQRKVTITKVEE